MFCNFLTKTRASIADISTANKIIESTEFILLFLHNLKHYYAFRLFNQTSCKIPIFLFSFMRANEASVKELKSSSSLLMGKELIDKKLTFWTITLWENEELMKRFRGSSSHKNAMKYLPKWCNEASYHHWVQEENEIPNWTTISDKLFSQVKLSKV